METVALKEKIETAQDDYLKGKLYADRWTNVRASGIGDECARRLFYLMTETVVSDDLERQAYFEEGKEQELGVKRYLSELGFEILAPSLTQRWQGISCKPDGVLAGKLLEIKTISEYAWDGLNAPEDFLKGKYYKKWYAQLQIGMLLFDREQGLFILKRKAAKQIKVIEIDLDFDYAEALLKKAELVNEAVKNNVPPDYLKNNPVECKRCQFFGKVCNPPLDFGTTALIEDKELADKLARREELSSNNSEYQKLDKEIKERLRGIPAAICGDYAITGKERIIKYAAQEVREVKRWRVEIERISVLAKE